MMNHFTIAELTYSQTAARKGIRNYPSAVERRNLMRLVNELLDPLRDAWAAHCLDAGLGSPGLLVTSGYRSTLLNEAVGGAPTSAHCAGLAADMVPQNGAMGEFCACVRQFLDGRDFDQLILERVNTRGVPQWVHLGLRSAGGLQRREVLALRDGKYTRLV